MYVFSSDKSVFKDFKNMTSSGSIALNDLLVQVGCKKLKSNQFNLVYNLIKNYFKLNAFHLEE
jgi:hypothetical protein